MTLERIGAADVCLAVTWTLLNAPGCEAVRSTPRGPSGPCLLGAPEASGGIVLMALKVDPPRLDALRSLLGRAIHIHGR